ncbi:hypothetical protein CDAR_39541 [Caerostris darwini]|uniref:Uncharacterized protein n=1 Tax=Caerostris darwini TaxID=1538125 RepID=A0AAV4U681_9ARAC|nr:hypothetical protein CDAR_39541 [Caerostris darwini]
MAKSLNQTHSRSNHLKSFKRTHLERQAIFTRDAIAQRNMLEELYLTLSITCPESLEADGIGKLINHHANEFKFSIWMLSMKVTYD